MLIVYNAEKSDDELKQSRYEIKCLCGQEIVKRSETDYHEHYYIS